MSGVVGKLNLREHYRDEYERRLEGDKKAGKSQYSVIRGWIAETSGVRESGRRQVLRE